MGDSVAWGQGLREPEKIHSRLAARIFAATGQEPNIVSYAASGAVIGYRGGSPTSYPVAPGWWPREIPQDNPSVLQQCERAALDLPGRRFDLVLVSGGINDVVVRKIFDPSTSPQEIRDRSRIYCRGAMGMLLRRIEELFGPSSPSLRVAVMGYYNILSPQSRPRRLDEVLDALAHERLARLRERVEEARLKVVINSVTFRDASAGDLSAAVSEAQARGGRTRFLFVDPGFTEGEAAFAPTPLVWGLDDSGRPEDPLAQDRAKYCGPFVGRPRVKDRLPCERASVGHPNGAGAAKYADAIFHALTGSL